MSVDPKSFNLPDMQAFGPDKVDDLARAVLTLTKELCVLADRQAVLERALKDAGITTMEALDTHQPDEALQQDIDARQSAIIKAVLTEISGVE